VFKELIDFLAFRTALEAPINFSRNGRPEQSKVLKTFVNAAMLDLGGPHSNASPLLDGSPDRFRLVGVLVLPGRDLTGQENACCLPVTMGNRANPQEKLAGLSHSREAD
jgi:hypothetical protein